MQKLKIFSLRELYLVAIFLMFNASFAFAQQIPHLITYKGDIKELAKDDGKVDKDEKEKKEKDKDVYNLTFRIYNLEIGGVALWEETHLQVPVKKGNFEVILGSITPLDLRFDEDYWLSIEVDSEGEIAPRERMTSVSYAYMSDDAWKLGGRYFEEYALVGHNHLGEDIITPVAEAINADTVDGLHADQLGGAKDHGLLEGLIDDDHLQYLNNLRGDERYAGAGWDGLTKLKTAQDHIADLNNPHVVTLEQLGHLDNNPEEEAPTAIERGEPTGTEIQGWADDIIAWGHNNLVTNLNADMVDGLHATPSSNPLPNTLLALDAEGKFPASVIPPITTPGLWTDADTYIYPNNAGSSFQIMDTGNLIVNSSVGIGTMGPLAKLDVRVGSASNNGVAISEDGTGGFLIEGDYTQFTPNNKLHITGTGFAGANGRYLTIVEGGKIGIGTTEPSEKLDVAGTVKLTGFKMPTGAVNGYVMTSDVNGAGNWQPATNGGPVAEAINADKVDGLHAGVLPTANYLYPLNANAKFPASILEGIVADADKLDGKDSTEFSLLGHFHTLMDLTDVTSDLRAAFLAAGAAGASGANRIATMSDILVTPPPLGLWTDEGTYIYPNNVGSGLQIMDTGHLTIAGNAGIVDAQTANPKGTLTIGQSLAGNNIDYSLVIARHGTNANPGTYSHTAPALLVQDFAGSNAPLAIDRDGLVRINAYRIGDTTENAANVTLFNVTNDQGGALRVDGRRNTFIGYWNEVTSAEKGSLFVKEKVGIGTISPVRKLHVLSAAGDSFPARIESTDGTAVLEIYASGSNEEAEIDLRSSFATVDQRIWNLNSGLNGGFAIRRLSDVGDNILDIPFYIATSGNVGIGTTEPRNFLQVKKSQPRETIIEVTNDDPNAIVGLSASREGWAQSAFLQYYGPSRDGGVGSELLAGDSVVIGSASGVTNGIRIIAANNGSHNAPIIFATGLWYAAAAERMRITSSGSVGIGTASPQGKLDVNGAIYQRGSLLHADYVFEPDYKLESIDEHAKFMWQEKHLKAVPKATKTEEGQEIVEVGARGKGVLEELEKAHIYIAQLNERIKKLEAKLEKQ